MKSRGYIILILKLSNSIIDIVTLQLISSNSTSQGTSKICRIWRFVEFHNNCQIRHFKEKMSNFAIFLYILPGRSLVASDHLFSFRLSETRCAPLLQHLRCQVNLFNVVPHEVLECKIIWHSKTWSTHILTNVEFHDLYIKDKHSRGQQKYVEFGDLSNFTMSNFAVWNTCDR